MKKLKYILFSIIILLLFYFVYYVTYNYVEPKAYDFMVKNVLTEKLSFDTNKNVYGHDDIVLIVIDNKTDQRYRWPWKRDLNCKIFNYLTEYAKPKVIVHDAILKSLDTDNPESDKKYFETVGKIDNLVAGFFPSIGILQDDEDSKKQYEKAFIEKFILPFKNKSEYYSPLYSNIMQFPKPYFKSIKHVGSVSVLPGFIDGKFQKNDENIRTYEPIVFYKDVALPSLAMETFVVKNDFPKGIIYKNSVEFPDLNYKLSLKNGDYRKIVPIKYYKLKDNAYSHLKYSAIDIMDSYDNIKSGKKPIIEPSEFKDKIVIIGANAIAATSLNDNKNTPITPNHAGVDIQATAIDNLVHNDFLKVVPLWVNILIMLLGMLLTYFVIRAQELNKAIFCTFILLSGYLFICSACFYYGIVLNAITPIVMIIITMIMGYIHKYLTEKGTKTKVENALGKYMSQDVMKKVLQNIDNLGLGGKKTTVTVLFSDIRGFTSLSENMSAEEVTMMLNEYFSQMEPIVRKYNGIINKFIGDAVMAIFGEPIQDENHPLNAVKCGYEMLQKVQELDDKWRQEGKRTFEIGVGINTGEVFVGNIGSAERMEYTVIGDTVNLASRLESYNKTYNTKILISSSTFEASKEHLDVNKISDVSIRGKAEKIDIYEVKNVNLQ